MKFLFRTTCLSFYFLTYFSFASIQTNITSEYDKSLAAYNEGNLDVAYIHIKNVLVEQPEFIPAKILSGSILQQMGFNFEAELKLTEALTAGADMELILLPLGRALLAQKKYEKVLILAKNKKLSVRTKVQLLLLKAKSYRALSLSKNEFNAYQLALRLSPKDNIVINELVGYYISENKFEKAQQIIDESFSIDSNNSDTWFLQGQIYKHQNNSAAASEVFVKILTNEPNYISAQKSLVTLHLKREDDAIALELLNKVLEEQPDDPRAMLLKANLLLKSNQKSLAKEILETLNQRLSLISDDFVEQNHWIIFISGMSSYLLNNYEGAIQEFKQYLTTDEHNFYAVSLIADSYIKLKQPSYARDILEKHLDEVVKRLDIAILLCDLYLNSRKTFKCESIIEQVEKTFQSNVKVTLAKARMLNAKKKFSLAVELLEEADNSSPNKQLKGYLIELYMRAGKPAKAAILINDLLKDAPQHLELMNALSASLVRLGMYDKAVEVTSHILRINPEYFPAKYNQASAFLENRKPQVAKKLAIDLVRLQPNHLDSRLLLAKSEIALGNSAQAINTLKGLLRKETTHVEGNELLAFLFQMTGQYEQALSILNNLTNRNRLEPRYLKMKAEIYLSLREMENFKKHTNILFSVWQNNVNGLIELSNLHKKAGDLSGARVAINQALSLDSKSSMVNYEDTKLTIYEKDFASAKKKLKKLLKNNKRSSSLIELEGDLSLSQGKLDSGQLYYLEAFKSDPTNKLSVVKSYNLAKKGFQKELFEKLLKETLNSKYNSYYYRNLLADFYLLENRHNEAKHQYIRLNRVDEIPNKADILNNLAYVSMKDDLGSALKYAEQASKLKPNSASILDTYGWILAQNKELKKALLVLRQAQSLNSSNPAIIYHLAYTLHSLGRTEEAIERLKPLRELSVVFYEKNQAMALLNELLAK